MNVVEYTFRDFKAKECGKRSHAELEGLSSLTDSSESLKNKVHSSIYKEFGCIS